MSKVKHPIKLRWDASSLAQNSKFINPLKQPKICKGEKMKILNHKNSIYKMGILAGILLLSLPAIVYAASYILNSGEFVGIGVSDGRIVFIENGTVDQLNIQDGDLGINVAAPGQKLHIGDGNILVEGGGETSIQIKRDQLFTGGPSGDSPNPIFHLGRIIQAGDGDPEFRVLYSDDNTAEEYTVFEFDRKGIIASVKTDRGSHFEGFISTTDEEPIFRLNSYPVMSLEMGNGGTTAVDVAIQRESASTMTFLTGDIANGGNEEMRIDSNGITVSDGYLKLDTIETMPPSTDCNEEAEVGRMKVDSVSPFLYICTASGWGKIVIGSVEVLLPTIQTP